jgi:hypothetical protein
MVEGCKSHSFGQASSLRRTDDGKVHLQAPSLYKGELIETLMVLPLRCLVGLTLFRKLSLKEGNLLRKALGVVASKGERCRVLCLCSRYPLLRFPLCQCSSALRIHDAEGCAIPCHSSFLGRTLAASTTM